MKYIQPNWPAPACIKAYTTTRHGWESRENGDETLVTLCHLPSEPLWLKQTHSAIVIEASPENKDKVADASYTRQPNHVCVVQTADCLPIFICDQDGTQVAIIHAGWRGLASGIIQQTLKHFAQPPEKLLIWLGPAIGPQKFEVGEDVLQAFAWLPHAKQAFQPLSAGKWLGNLYELANLQLISHGITQIYGKQYCTYTQEDLFFSYRRDQGKTGRLASLIWISH